MSRKRQLFLSWNFLQVKFFFSVQMVQWNMNTKNLFFFYIELSNKISVSLSEEELTQREASVNKPCVDVFMFDSIYFGRK